MFFLVVAPGKGLSKRQRLFSSQIKNGVPEEQGCDRCETNRTVDLSWRVCHEGTRGTLYAQEIQNFEETLLCRCFYVIL